MRALVVFESMFGNTRDVAAAVADGLGSHLEVDLVEVGSAPADLGGDVALLVVGAPTHAFGMSRPRTRRSAAEQAARPLVSATTGVREWLGSLPGGGDRPAAATFDTRVHRPRVPGSAARAAERELRRRGFRMVTRAESFWVTGSAGALLAGEVDRARSWGERVGSEVSDRSGAGP